MLVFSLAASGRAVDYLRPARADSAPFLLREIGDVVPVAAWGVVWGVTALVLFVWAFRQRHGVALGILAGISMIWAAVYSLTAILVQTGMVAFDGDPVRAWNAAFAFLLFFVVVVAMAKMINPARRSRKIIE
jgi:hypothetical protein